VMALQRLVEQLAIGLAEQHGGYWIGATLTAVP
jgi:hypothetical protein